MFLSSEKGKRILNFCYSWGASVVIIGALFKLLHLPYANQILFVSLITESLVFFVSAFERPGKDYQWEDVFPVLETKNPMDRPDFSNQPISSMINSEANALSTEETGKSVQINGVGGSGNLNIAGSLDLSEEDTNNLSASIKKLTAATEQLSKMSDTILESYQALADNKDVLTDNSRGYAQHMEQLNRNVAGLSSLYEIQLRSVSSQMEAIEHINGGLNRIKDMYDGSVVDSAAFRNETERMARQLAQLNQVYGRLLAAMNVNMMPPQQPMPPQQQPNMYAQQPYGGQQPQQPYGNY